MSLGIVLTGSTSGHALAPLSGEGSDSADETQKESTSWSGTWQFAKDRGPSDLQFSYKRVSDSIPYSLYEYVSFLDANSKNMRSASKKTKRKKARPTEVVNTNNLKGQHNLKVHDISSELHTQQSSPPAAAQGTIFTTPSFVAPISEDMGSLDHPRTPTADKNDDESEEEGDDDGITDAEPEGGRYCGDECNVNVDEHPTDGAIEIPDPSQDTMSNSYTASSTKSDAAIYTNGENPSPNILLDIRHPLMGLWEGTFFIKTSTQDGAVYESVEEVFFFYGFLGDGRAPTSMSQLPPEPHFSHVVLKESIHGTFLKQLIGMNKGEKQQERALVSPGIEDARVADENLSASSVIPIQLTPFERGPQTILLGFGRNPYGRFSLTAAYDATTGKLVCEKRYMLHKAIQKKNHHRVSGSADGSVETEGRSSSRVRQLSSVGIVENDSSIDIIGSKRKRIVSSKVRNANYAELFDTEEMDFVLGASSTSDSQQIFHTQQQKSTKQTQQQLQQLQRSHNLLLQRQKKIEMEIIDGEDYRYAYLDEESGEIYEGEWKNGCRHGRGICLFSDGNMYEGSWSHGKPHGKGSLIAEDGHILYTGEWFDGLMHGHGTYTFANGDSYTGDWREGIRQGRGHYKLHTGSSYKGDWRDNRRHGKGVFTWADGSFYDGEWEHDFRHGRGTLELKEENFKYDGFWTTNFMDGRGISIFPGGQEYQGAYRMGLREGRGSIIFPEGAVYEGRFKDDRIDGQGTIQIHQTVPGVKEGETMIPIQIQADLKRVHLKAGFVQGPGGH